jgi:3-mercaptopyruvate sulfurtransferase SseA
MSITEAIRKLVAEILSQHVCGSVPYDSAAAYDSRETTYNPTVRCLPPPEIVKPVITSISIKQEDATIILQVGTSGPTPDRYYWAFNEMVIPFVTDSGSYIFSGDVGWHVGKVVAASGTLIGDRFDFNFQVQ